MNRFNLTFKGEIIAGHDPQRLRARLAQILAIEDQRIIDRYFSGDPVVVHRNLERKEAAELYVQLRRQGIVTELVKIGERGDLHSGAKTEIRSRRKTAKKTAVNNPKTGNAAKAAIPAPAEMNAPKAVRRVDLAAQKILQTEEAAQLRAKEKALKKALKAKEKERLRQQKVSERARQKTLQREARHKAALEASQRKAEQAKKKREAVELKEEQARLMNAEAAAMSHAELEAEQAAEVARQKAEAIRMRAAQRARLKAEAEEQRAQRRAMEEQAIERGASELAQKPSLKAVNARVKTRMEMPSLQRRKGDGSVEKRRKRQPGEPNLFSLHPFRNTPEIRARAVQSRRIMRLAFITAAAAVAAATAIVVAMAISPATTISHGASAVAIDPQGRPLLFVPGQLLMHDRAGVSTSELDLASLGLTSLEPPLAFDADGNLLLSGRLDIANGQQGGESNEQPLQLLRCALTPPHCDPLSGELGATVVSALAVHPVDGSVFIADTLAGELLKLDADGKLLARAEATLPPRPVLRLDSGLLLVNSAQGPAISVLRYENEAFGQQLDEILLLRSAEEDIERSNVLDFLWSGEQWWVLLDRASGRGRRLYRFDTQWQYIDESRLAPGGQPSALSSWGSRTLLVDPSRIPIQRFDARGLVEAPLVSPALTRAIDAQTGKASLIALAWRLALTLSVLAAITAFGMGCLHRVRSLVYTSCKEQGAESVDRLADKLDWLDLDPLRASSMRKSGLAYAALAVAVVLAAVGFGVSSLQLSALLLALSGPAAALLLLQRSDPGHIGISDNTLVLVDHEGTYHLGSGARIHYRGPFLMIDDVTVFTGRRFLPAFAPAPASQRLNTFTAGGVRVDRKIVAIKLLHSRHPLALGAISVFTAAAAAIALLSLQGIF